MPCPTTTIAVRHIGIDLAADDGLVRIVHRNDVGHAGNGQSRQRQIESQADQKLPFARVAGGPQTVPEDVDGKGVAQRQGELVASDRRENILDRIGRGEIRLSEQVETFLEIDMLTRMRQRPGYGLGQAGGRDAVPGGAMWHGNQRHVPERDAVDGRPPRDRQEVEELKIIRHDGQQNLGNVGALERDDGGRLALYGQIRAGGFPGRPKMRDPRRAQPGNGVDNRA